MKCISFYAGNFSILFNLIFPFLPSIFNFVNILVENNLKKQDWWHQSNNYVVFRKPTQVFHSASSRKNIPQGLNRAHQILIKNGFLTNKLRVASYGLLQFTSCKFLFIARVMSYFLHTNYVLLLIAQVST